MYTQPYYSLGLRTAKSSRLAFGGREGIHLVQSLLYSAILKKFTRKKLANPTRPLQLMSGSTYTAKKKVNLTVPKKKKKVRFWTVTTGSTCSPTWRKKVLQGEKSITNKYSGKLLIHIPISSAIALKGQVWLVELVCKNFGQSWNKPQTMALVCALQWHQARKQYIK